MINEILVHEDFIVIARRLMKEIMYDSGMVMNTGEVYPEKHVMAIAMAAQPFFDKYPLLMNDEDMEQICSGEYGENQEKYGKLDGYRELDKALNAYFNNE